VARDERPKANDRRSPLIKPDGRISRIRLSHVVLFRAFHARHSQEIPPAWPSHLASLSSRRGFGGMPPFHPRLVSQPIGSLSFLARRQPASAPSLRGRYPASSLLSQRFCFCRPPCRPGIAGPDSCTIPFTDAPPPYTPESPATALDHFFAADAGFDTFGRLATPI
jgi:hypothetical protein